MAGASALALGLTAPPPTGAHGAGPPSGVADPYEALRRRWLTLQLGEGFDPATEPYATRLAETAALARRHRATLRPAAGSLWPDLPFDPPAGITQSCLRLNVMAQAYAQPGTGATGDPELATAAAEGLAHVHDRVYNPSTTRYGNWWEWQIGTPRLLLDTVAILYEHLAQERRTAYLAAVDHFVPDEALGSYSGTSTGANRVDLCRVVALRGVLGRSAARLALARDALSPVFPLVTRGDGLYADGSFVQHTRVAYTGTYGQVLLDGLARLFTLLAGSDWAVTDPRRQIVLDSVEKAYAPLLHDGLMMDTVNGRAISRGLLTADEGRVPRGDHFHGHAVLASVALLADAASEAERERWYGMVKGWIARDTVRPVLADPQFSVAELARLRAVADGPWPAAPERTGHTLFAAMDRAVHRRPGWVAALAMASDRIAHYENGNGENPRGWHTGAGMLLWWVPGTGDQYTDAYWPTADWYRLPGTTVSAKRLADNEGGPWGEPVPAARWVGGTTDGEYAAVGQHLKGLGSTLEARKSWFCAADAIVCLTAGVSARDGTPVETIVDDRNLGAAGTAALTVDGVTAPGGGADWSGAYRRAHWAHLAGHGGYVFPGGARLRARREARTGSWRDINAGGSPEPLTRRHLTLWHDHGTDPVAGSLAYLLMPGAGRAALARRAADRRWLSLLVNTVRQQAVAIDSLGLTAVNFWEPGTVARLTASAPASVLLRRGPGPTAALRVSEPPRSGAPLEIGWDHPVRRVTAVGPGVEVLATRPRLRLRIDPGTAGATRSAQLEPA
ncbi:polysaccharide lyase 8 family protein [Streptomyces sp. URMC 123]|uniref:polysaccharide lyase 8 family protein n=1 Tax=Streptomyces sp. URMC 123 TaxID=3423403 RepID=UPI003F1D672D